MRKKFSIALWATIVFQLLTAVFHSISFIIKPVASNATEEQMLRLMDTYKMNMGNGIFRTFSELVITLSVNLSLLCLMAGLVNWFLKRKQVAGVIWKGVLLIQCFIFGILLIIVLLFGFLLPLVCVGLIFISCIAARLTAQSNHLS